MTNTCYWIFAVAAIGDAMEHVPILECAVGYYSSNPQAHLNMGSSTQTCYLIPFLYDLHQKEILLVEEDIKDSRENIHKRPHFKEKRRKRKSRLPLLFEHTKYSHSKF